MRASVAKLDYGPLPILADNDVFNLAKPIREGLAPAIVVGLVGILARKLLAAGDILERTVFGDDLCTMEL